MFDNRTISALLSLSRTLNFKSTAIELDLSQPTLTRLIQKAERDADLVIFKRSAARIELTNAGRKVVELCRQQKISNEQFRKNIARAATGVDRVEIVCGPLTTLSLVAPALKMAKEEIRKTQVSVKVTADMDSKVLSPGDSADIFVGDLTHTASTDGLEIVKVPSKELVVVAPPGHPITEKGAVLFAEAFNYPIASPFLHKHWKSEFEAILVKAGIDPRWREIPAIETDDFSLIENLVRSGGYLSGGTKDLFSDAIKAGKLVQVNVKGAPSWNICIARKMNNERPSVEAIWKNLVQVALEISRSD